jgi:hypothetical protein
VSCSDHSAKNVLTGSQLVSEDWEHPGVLLIHLIIIFRGHMIRTHLKLPLSLGGSASRDICAIVGNLSAEFAGDPLPMEWASAICLLGSHLFTKPDHLRISARSPNRREIQVQEYRESGGNRI